MLLYNAHKKNQGFTLIETLTIVVIIGILSAIVAPSFLNMFSRNNVNDALAQVRGALQEAQREAMRKSKPCTVTIPEGNDPNIITIMSSPSSCLVTGSRTLKGINLDHYDSTVPLIVTFDFKGRTNNVASAGTIILSSPNTSGKKCLVVSQGLGMVRTGNYDESTTPAKCNTVL